MDAVPFQEPKRYIEAIRKDKFGIAPDGTKQANALERDLRAALKNLAEELNAKETHFILELLQNAEDNTYADAVEPELRIFVDSADPTESGGDGCLCFLNNEVGFTPEQVLSLCSVGQSTKEKAHGYIGEKGIGFKSVFRVSDQPHIFSNGFRFRFQKPRGSEDLGYIVPQWVDSVPDLVLPAFTAILLPLVPGKRAGIAQKLLAIPAETILFLTKLRRLVVGTDHYIARDKTSGFVRLTSDGDDCEYFVHREPWQRPPTLQEEKRGGVAEREVTVALPLKSPRPCTGRVFAFLPTDLDTGLPFLINADFLLSASRDNLLEDRPWNEWLRDNIGPTFAKAFMSLLDQSAWKQDAYRFLPVQQDIIAGAEFFAPVIQAVHAALQKQACVLSIDGNLIPPSPAYFASPRARRLLATPPPKHATFPLVHHALEAHRKRLEPIGVSVLKTIELLSICGDPDWLKARDTEWWLTLFELLSAQNAQADTVGSFPLLRCTDGICRPPSGKEVFFHAEGQPAPSVLPPEWPAAHLFDGILQVQLQEKPAVWGWLRSATNLQPFSIQTYITDRLLVWLAQLGTELAPTTLLSVTRFIADNLRNLDEQAKRTVSEKLPWLLSSGRILSSEQRATRELVTPECLEGESGWNWVFISEQDRQHFSVLSDTYVQDLQEGQREAMLALFKQCNAINWPDPATIARPGGQTDWAPPRWLRDLTLDSPPQNIDRKVSALERWAGRFEPENFAKFLSVTQAGYERHAAASNPSELAVALRTRPWLQTTKGLTPPEAAFLNDPQIKEFLQDSVPYVLSKLSSELLEKFGTRVRLSATSLLDLLRQMRESGNVEEALVVRIYRRLQDIAFDTTVFRQEPLVFLSHPKARWMKAETVFWRDAGDVFDEEFGYAELTYGNDELHGFFTDKLGVLENPQAEQFCEVWARMSAGPALSAETIQRRLAMILPQLASLVEGGDSPGWWPALRPTLKVWTTSQSLVHPSTAFAPDHSLAEDLFGNTAPIAWLPKSHQFSRLNRFLRDLGCQSLAMTLTSVAVNTNGYIALPQPRFLTQASKEILVSWVCATGEWTSQKQHLESLLHSDEVGVSELLIKYSLSTATVSTDRPADAFWSPGDRRLYLREGATLKARQSAVAATIASRIARAGKQGEDTIYRLLSLEPADAQREISERKWELSPDQQAWLRSLGIELIVLQVSSEAEPLKREARPAAQASASQPPHGKGSAPPPDTGSKGASSMSAEMPTVAGQEPGSASPQEAQGGPPADMPAATRPPAGGAGANPPEGQETQGQPKSTQAGQGSPAVESQEEVLKPADADADFVHVVAHTRRRPYHERQRREAGATRPNGDHPMGSLAHATKAQVEEAAVRIIFRLFGQRPELAGFKVLDLRNRNLGFDLHAVKQGKSIRIEVKAHLRQAQSVFVTAKEWQESQKRSHGPPEDHWELWNVENLAADAGRVRVTRYSQLPDHSRTRESGYWVDLSVCSSDAFS